jgi:hypothetical protein
MARQDVEAFVQSLKDFEERLPPAQQAMLQTILDAAQQNDTAGYAKRTRTETNQGAEQGDEARWERLAEWLNKAQGDEDTEGFGFKRS